MLLANSLGVRDHSQSEASRNAVFPSPPRFKVLSLPVSCIVLVCSVKSPKCANGKLWLPFCAFSQQGSVLGTRSVGCVAGQEAAEGAYRQYLFQNHLSAGQPITKSGVVWTL